VIPFKLPDSLTIPYLGTVMGDGVIYVLLAGLIVVLLLLFVLVGIIRGSGARARLAAAVIDEASKGVTLGSTQVVNTTAVPVRGMSEIGSATPYRTMLAQLADHLAEAEAENICIGELDGGYLLLYNHTGEPVVETLTTEQVAALSPSHKGKRNTARLRHNLTQVGRFLDQQFAISVLVAQQNEGYYVEYAATPSGAHAASKLVRVGRLMDEESLERLGGTGILGTS
jgi:hypothetical protein